MTEKLKSDSRGSRLDESKYTGGGTLVTSISVSNGVDLGSLFQGL